MGICRAALNHVDLDAATEHDVLVVNTPGRNARAVAELTLGLMLSLARRIPYLDGYVKSGRWEDPVDGYVNHRGLELEGRTLGLIGLGAVGSVVSGLAKAFGMKVLAYDPYAGEVGGTTLRRPSPSPETAAPTVQLPLPPRPRHQRNNRHSGTRRA